MTRWDQSPEIFSLADALGVGGAMPVASILDYCHGRIDSWVSEIGGVNDIVALESLVTQKLQLVFEEVRSNEDWDRLKEVYARGKKEVVFAGLSTKFDDDDNLTYGALVERRNATASDPDRFVAVIDCRGNKLARRFFTRWHEIAHRLTTHGDLFEPVYRSEHDPIERMMDEIAGHVGFYDPLFQPAFQSAVNNNEHLTFDAVESIIVHAFPAASFQATLFTCIRRMATPVVYLEAALGHKKEVRSKLATMSLFDEAAPPGELRAVKVIQNQAAKTIGFTIPTNMRVPADSVIQSVFDAEPQSEQVSEENLSLWESHGRSLKGCEVYVVARKIPDRVVAIVQPYSVCKDRSTWQD